MRYMPESRRYYAATVYILLMLIINLHSYIAVGESGGNEYSVIVDGAVLRIKLVFQPADEWILNYPLRVSYEISVSNSTEGSYWNEFSIVMNLDVFCRNGVSTMVKFLGVLEPNKTVVKGVASLLPPPKLIECVAKNGRSTLTLIPRIIVAGHTVESVEFAPLQLYARIEDKENALAEECVVDTRYKLELCVVAPYTFDPSEEKYSMIVYVTSWSSKTMDSLIMLTRGSTLLASQFVRKFVTYYRTELGIPTRTLSLLCMGSKTVDLSIQAKFIESNNSYGVALRWTIACAIKLRPLLLKLYVPRERILAGDELTILGSIENPNSIPVYIDTIELFVNDSLRVIKKVESVLREGGKLSFDVNVTLREVGVSALRVVVKYLIGMEQYEIEKNVSVRVSPSILIEAVTNIVHQGDDLTLIVSVLRSVRGLKLVIEGANRTQTIWIYGYVPGPIVLKRNIVMDVPPGNYTVRVVSLEGLESNSMKIMVVPKTVKTRTETTITRTVSTTPISARASIKLLSARVAPGSKVRLEVDALGISEPVEVKVFRKDPRFTPPWILIPNVEITRIGAGKYRVEFRAPETSGMYSYRIEVYSGKTVIAKKEVTIEIVKISSATMSIAEEKPLLPMELFAPLIGTAVVAAVLIYRRARR